jgi:hypothetical protein
VAAVPSGPNWTPPPTIPNGPGFDSTINTNTRNVPGGKGRPAFKADNITAICEPIV